MRPSENTSSTRENEIRTELRDRLLALNYNAFTWVMIHLLERLGYADLRPAGRTGFFGRNNGGGYDLEAKLPFALGERTVIVQVKQYGQQMVFRRAVDALRGACLRTGADEALILTLGPIAPSLRPNESHNGTTLAAPGIAPVQLVDGGELLDLLVLHAIGILRDDFGDPWLDCAYFTGLERLHEGKGPADGETTGGRQPHFVLTVGVEQLGRKRATPGQVTPERVTRVIV